MVRGVAPVHASSIFNCLDLSPPYSVMGWWTRADSTERLFANAWHIGTSQQEWWQNSIFSVQCAAQHRMKCRPWPDSWANQLMSVWRYITVGQCFIHSSWDGLKSSTLRRLEFCDEEGLINAFKVIFSSKEERYTVKRDVFTGQHFITQMSCCSEEWTPSANQEESPVSTKTSFFSERINAAHVLKLQPPRHHILLIFVSLIQAAFSTVFYEDIRFHIKSLEGFPSAYWLRWPT